MQSCGENIMAINRKHILILGGSSDIGMSLVKLYLKKNWKVTAHYNSNLRNLKKIKSQNLLTKKFDFSLNIKSLESRLTKIFNDKYDAIINLVGYIDNQGFQDFNINDCLKTIKINAVIPFFLINKLSSHMLKNKWGRILNCSSIGVKYGGGKNSFNYSLSKQTQEFLFSDIKKWAEKNVLYNVIRIGVINTKIHKKIQNKDLNQRINLIPMKKMGKIEDIENFIYFLVSEKNQFITGEKITISGGE
ncbi:MAG: hypothetical protein CMG62_11680 [Candidatus Marinimicrobia bacterium]|nr:hypothetical protein [Candidatus Neomarinimicrobiota bacterium]